MDVALNKVEEIFFPTADSLRIGASEKRVAELHQQVQAGTYQPNAQRIAEKILGYRD